MSSIFRSSVGPVLLLALAFLPRVASAAPCNQITKLAPGGGATPDTAPPVVYVTGGTAVKPLLAELAPLMFADPQRPATIVFRSQSSCAGVDAIVSGIPIAANDVTTASYWDPNSIVASGGSKTAKEETCTLVNGTVANLGVSDVFAETCGGAQQGLPPGLADFQGPIQAMTFAVNKASKEQSISAAAAYLAFGTGQLAPWTDPAFLFRRNQDSGTQLMIGAAIGVPATRFLGVDKGGSGGVLSSLTALVGQTDIDKAIGILAADFSARPELRALAYQHTGQRCGYKPDRQPLDKKNVRDGHYAIWGPLHLLTKVDQTGLAENLGARDLIAYLTGTQPPPLGATLIRTAVQNHVVPPCAMKVQRLSEMGPLQSFKPPRACGCAFDREALGSTTCTACSSNAQCGASQSCNFGFCEAQ